MQVEVWQQMQPSITNRTRAFPENDNAANCDAMRPMSELAQRCVSNARQTMSLAGTCETVPMRRRNLWSKFHRSYIGYQIYVLDYSQLENLVFRFWKSPIFIRFISFLEQTGSRRAKALFRPSENPLIVQFSVYLVH